MKLKDIFQFANNSEFFVMSNHKGMKELARLTIDETLLKKNKLISILIFPDEQAYNNYKAKEKGITQLATNIEELQKKLGKGFDNTLYKMEVERRVFFDVSVTESFIIGKYRVASNSKKILSQKLNRNKEKIIKILDSKNKELMDAYGVVFFIINDSDFFDNYNNRDKYWEELLEKVEKLRKEEKKEPAKKYSEADEVKKLKEFLELMKKEAKE